MADHAAGTSKGRTGRTLTEMQRAFCREYAESMDAYQAAIAAGYAETTARMEAEGWLKKRHLAREIFRILADVESEKEPTED